MSATYKTDETKIDDITLLEPEGVYSYADYLKWTFDERVEIIKGKLFKMSPAPRRTHQEVGSNLHVEIGMYLKGKSCNVYSAPFDVRFPKNSNEPNSQTYTVVQPDLCVVCDETKLDDAGCKGAPDLIIEILSPSTASKDLTEKYQLYQEHGVNEYWIVYPGENVIEAYDLNEEGKYISRGKFVRENSLTSNVLIGLNINLTDVFRE
ncbi:MAG: Uma2 family endonuclease [Cyclobacteriaceae bacterium]|jgi:Uma2 family endonuclease